MIDAFNTTGIKRALPLLLAVCSVVAFTPDAKAIESAFGPVTISRLDGTTLNGTIQAIDRDGKITGPGIPENLTLDEVLSVQTQKEVQATTDFQIALRLADGGKLLIDQPRIEGDWVRFESTCGLKQVSLQALRSIVWQSTPLIEQRIAQPSPDQDLVVVATDQGDRFIEGIVEGLDDKRLTINYKKKSRGIGLSKIKAIIMADLGLVPPEGTRAIVRMTDGSTIAGIITGLAENQLIVAMAGGSRVALDVQSVAGFSIVSDRLAFLSDLQPVDVQQRTQFALMRPWQKDRSIEGNQLAIRYGSSPRIARFEKGLGTQAFTQLVFEVGDYDRLLATVGIDAETKGRGDCQMVIQGDGIQLWAKRVQGTGEPIPVDIDIHGIKQITLLVYPGENFDLADHADWGNIRLIRTQ